MAEALLQIRDLRKSYDGIVANDAVSIDVPRGAIVGLVGPNGSGKTTLFNAIGGQQAADSGSVRFDGREISNLDTPTIARLGILRTFQQAHVYRHMSCLDNLRASDSVGRNGMRELFSAPSRAVDRRALELLDFVDLGALADTDAERISFGQRKLLEFAMALMSQPQLLLLDEPTAGVDPGFVALMVDRLSQANALMQVTLLVIEHNLDALHSLAHYIYMLERGAVVAQGAPADIHDRLKLAAAPDGWQQ